MDIIISIGRKKTKWTTDIIIAGTIDTFNLLRYSLNCMVVIYTLQGNTYKTEFALLYRQVIDFIQEAWSRSVVPVFFVISGYLFIIILWNGSGKFVKVNTNIYTVNTIFIVKYAESPGITTEASSLLACHPFSEYS